MSLLTVPPELCAKLNEPLPAEAISAHPTKNYLSTIKTIFQVERLNEVFGIGGWTAKSEVIESGASMVILRVTLKVPYYGIELEQYGGNDNSDRGDAYKGAFTDALSKICGYLGIGMDVYKGEGPTKSNPRGSKAASDAVRDRLLKEAEESKAKRAAAKAVPDQPPDTLEMDLRASLELVEAQKRPKKAPSRFEMLKAFGALKKKYKGMKLESEYYNVLGQHGVEHSSDFPDTEKGLSAARVCYGDMRIHCADLETQLITARLAREKADELQSQGQS